MNQFNKGQVILISSENNPKLWLHPSYNEIALHKENEKFYGRAFGYHLYIVSEDEIREGDYWINLDRNTVNSGDLYNLANDAPSCKKIVATTDYLYKYIRMLCKSCKGSGGGFGSNCKTCKGSGIRIETDLLPKPSQQSLVEYVEYYNSNQIITDVLIEYETKQLIKPYDVYNETVTCLKVNTKDNTITWKKPKNSWNKEEHIANIKAFAKEFVANTETAYKQADIDRWIEKNL